MFTGIIEAVGQVHEITSHGTNKTFWISSQLTSELKVDQSIAHNGVCLTIEEIKAPLYRVTAVKETLDKTNLGSWQAGSYINLERSLLPTSRLDGHFVQGHVDTTGLCKSIKDCNGSYELEFEFSEEHAPLIIEKGSISINGISLTAFAVQKTTFKVAIIPFTWTHTNLQYLQQGDKVNLEFDMIGKYILRKTFLYNYAE
jgi:riboflavin synthase